MRPIDALTGLPKSPEVARLVAAQARHGETQSHSQVSLFSREMRERESSVNEAQKLEGGLIDSESGDGGGAYDGGDRKPTEDRHNPSSNAVRKDHPSKGKVLDIRGS